MVEGLAIASGVVSQPANINIAGISEAISLIELRSPVRLNDQFTVLDRHYSDSGEDYDGDGRRDSLDLAMYVVVVGQERLDLENARQLQATRVDTVILARARYSSTGAYSQLLNMTQSRWYSPGIGIVRTRAEQPGPINFETRHVTDERLVSWDGLTGGVGPMGIVTGQVPTGPSAGATLPAPLDAVAFSDQAVVMTYRPGHVMAGGIALSRLDRRGNVLQSTNHALPGVVPSRLVRFGDELRVVALGDDGLLMYAFDGTGAVALSSQPVLLAAGEVVASTDGIGPQAGTNNSGLWALWLELRDEGNSTWVVDVKLQPFDGAGQPSSPAIMLAASLPAGGIYKPVLSVSNDRVLVTWQAVEAGTAVIHSALVDAQTHTVFAQAPLRSDDSRQGVAPLADSGRLLVVWNAEPAVGRLLGVGLDASLQPSLPPGQALVDQFLTPTWLQRVQGNYRLAGDGAGKVVLAHGTSARYRDEDTQPVYFTSVSEIDVQGSSVLSTIEPRLLARVPTDFGNVKFTLMFDDRVLLLGERTNVLTAVPVWRRL